MLTTTALHTIEVRPETPERAAVVYEANHFRISRTVISEDAQGHTRGEVDITYGTDADGPLRWEPVQGFVIMRDDDLSALAAHITADGATLGAEFFGEVYARVIAAGLLPVEALTGA